MTDLPPLTCRECDDRVRTFNTFRCPVCHPEATPQDHPRLAHLYHDVAAPDGADVVTDRDDGGWMP